MIGVASRWASPVFDLYGTPRLHCLNASFARFGKEFCRSRSSCRALSFGSPVFSRSLRAESWRGRIETWWRQPPRGLRPRARGRTPSPDMCRIDMCRTDMCRTPGRRVRLARFARIGIDRRGSPSRACGREGRSSGLASNGSRSRSLTSNPRSLRLLVAASESGRVGGRRRQGRPGLRRVFVDAGPGEERVESERLRRFCQGSRHQALAGFPGKTS